MWSDLAIKVVEAPAVGQPPPGVVAVVVQPSAPAVPSDLRGGISVPSDNALVPRCFRVKGTIERLPPDFHLWLAVEIGNLAWPKEPEMTITGTSWSGNVCPEVPPSNGAWSLSLYMVNSEGHQEIRRWLKDGQRTGDYPGRPEITGGQRLHQIPLRLQQ